MANALSYAELCSVMMDFNKAYDSVWYLQQLCICSSPQHTLTAFLYTNDFEIKSAAGSNVQQFIAPCHGDC